jgi:hypothetical protein
MPAQTWHALLAWRQDVDPVLQRLYAPVAHLFSDLATEPEALRAEAVRQNVALPIELQFCLKRVQETSGIDLCAGQVS